MIDQLRVGNDFSYDDFDASIKERSIAEPEKKSIKDTVPYSNRTYDFSALNGEVYWEERKLEYVFEISADSPEELEEKKRKFLAWIMFIQEAEIHDPFIIGYHFKGTFDSIKVDDSEVEKSTITVTFAAYPYLIANTDTEYVIATEAGEEKTVNILNSSVHKVIPTLQATTPLVIAKGNSSLAVPSGTMYDEAFEFLPGKNVLVIKNSGAAKCTLTITFKAEVM